MKPTEAVTATDHGCGRARKVKLQRSSASAEGPIAGCGEARRGYAVCEERRAGKQSRLTIFCDATGAGSALYFRALSGACDSDMLILRARWSEKDAGKPGLSTPADEGEEQGAVALACNFSRAEEVKARAASPHCQCHCARAPTRP